MIEPTDDVLRMVEEVTRNNRRQQLSEDVALILSSMELDKPAANA